MQLGYVIIYVPDVKATVDFYEKAFGCKLRYLHEGNTYAEMETGKTALAFVDEMMMQEFHDFKINRLKEKAAGVEIAFVDENVAHRFEHAVKAGAMIVGKPMEKPWGQTVCYLKDNNGFLVEICSPLEK